jgi:sortase A
VFQHRNLLHWIEKLMWIVAAATLAVFICVIAAGDVYQFYLNREFDEALAEQEFPLNQVNHVNKPQPIQPSVSQAVSAPEWPSLGRLRIPRLDMSIMVLDGIDNRTLRLGIGHIPGTALPGGSGNAGIAGHRDTFLRGLGRIRKDDRITVETMGGSFLYVVDSIRVVNPEAVEVLSDFGHPVLTLVTCYPFHVVGPAPKRFVVRSSLDSLDR